jgi:hypothetical protein
MPNGKPSLKEAAFAIRHARKIILRFGGKPSLIPDTDTRELLTKLFEAIESHNYALKRLIEETEGHSEKKKRKR